MHLAIVSLSLAAESPTDFVSSLEAPPFLIASCPTVAEAASLMGPALGGSEEPFPTQHMDPEGPLNFAMIPGPGGVAVVYRVGMLDPAAWVLSETARLRHQGWIEQDGRWEGPDGSLAQYRVDGDVGELRAWTSMPMDDRLQATGGLTVGDLERATDLDDGCLVAMGVRVPNGEELVILVEPMESDRIEGLLFGSAVDSMSAGFVSQSPPEEARLNSTKAPDLYVRMNVDMHLLADSWQQSSGPQAALGAAVQELEDARVRLHPGAETAIWVGGGSVDVLMVIPLKRPRKAERILKKLAKDDLGDLGDDGILVLEGEQTLFLAADGNDLVVGTSPSRVFAALEPQGTIWGAATTADQPGMSFQISENTWVAAMAASGRGAGSSGIPAVDVHIQDEADALSFSFHAPGYTDWVSDLVESRNPTSAQDPVGRPPSTEALSVLMSISSAEDRIYDERGFYLPYSGGPRDVADLDATTVTWEGIPELSIGAMETACRYEIKLSIEGYAARSICDEDGDGLHAVTVMSPGARPRRVTPGEVR